MILKKAIPLLATVLLGGCAHPPANFLEGVPLVTPDGDTLQKTSMQGKTTAFVFVDPICPMVQEASQRGGMLEDVEESLRKDGVELVLVGVSGSTESLKPGDFRAWQKEARLQTTRMILDTTAFLARRENIPRLPWALVLDAKGMRRYSGPAESMQTDTSEFLLPNAAHRALLGMNTPAGEEEGEGCPLDL